MYPFLILFIRLFSLQEALSFKVWLDYEHQSTLLCTLRPDRCEQFPLNLTLCCSDSGDAAAGKDYYTLRLEVQTLSKRRRSAGMESENMLALESYEIYIVGSSLNAPHDHTDDEEGSDSGVCPL